MAETFRPPWAQFEASTGVPLAGAKLHFYQVGTTTDITVYQDNALGTPHANPVVAAADGMFAPIFIDSTTNTSYKVVLKTSADVTVQTVDNIQAATGSASFLDSAFEIKDNGDPTKKLAFQVSSVTTGTTRTLTVPDANGTIALTSDIPNTKTLAPINLGIAASVGSSALTIALKGADGLDPSASNPVYIPFRNVTPGTGTPSVLTVTSATSLVISSGSTLGAPTGSVPFKLWLVAFNDGGTLRLGVITATTLVSGALTIYPLAAYGIASSTAEGGAGAADTAQTFYTGTAVTSKAYTVLAALHYETGLATAGTWASAPTRVQLFDASVPLPGRVVQSPRTQVSASATSTTTLPTDDTIPQITEGTEFMTQAITPSSAANVLEITASSFLFTSGSIVIGSALFQDATANALAAVAGAANAADQGTQLTVQHTMIAATTSATTFRSRSGRGGGAVTITFNGQAGARIFGGTASSYIEVLEISA